MSTDFGPACAPYMFVWLRAHVRSWCQWPQIAFARTSPWVRPYVYDDSARVAEMTSRRSWHTHYLVSVRRLSLVMRLRCTYLPQSWSPPSNCCFNAAGNNSLSCTRVTKSAQLVINKTHMCTTALVLCAHLVVCIFGRKRFNHLVEFCWRTEQTCHWAHSI